MTWKTTSSKEVYKNAWMHVTEDQVVTDFGATLTYGVVHKEPCALIIPREHDNYTLVGQYRYPISKFSWEFPQGHYIGSSILETAETELLEETGITATSFVDIGSFYIAPGVHNQICHVFLATNLTKGNAHREASEQGMECKDVSMNQLIDMIRNQDITDGLTICALSLLRIYDATKR